MSRKRISDYFNGTHEVLELEDEEEQEASLHKSYKDCKKNPGHVNFIPVKEFSAKHLPARYQDDDLLELVRRLSDLTVQITVKYTSLDRPQFVAGSTAPYPCYNNRGRKAIRTGSGWVDGMTKYIDIDNRLCECEVCLKTKEPVKEWGEIDVLTAKHVVYDEGEAKRSTCRLWFDDDRSPGVRLAGWGVSTARSDVLDDRRPMHYVTHDLALLDKIDGMFWNLFDICDKIKKKYESLMFREKFTVIVSHPHGCSKQVSVGTWEHRDTVREGWTRYTYETCTCPGSSGAWVYILGGGRPGHPHSGSKDGRNYSGTWDEAYPRGSGDEADPRGSGEESGSSDDWSTCSEDEYNSSSDQSESSRVEANKSSVKSGRSKVRSKRSSIKSYKSSDQPRRPSVKSEKSSVKSERSRDQPRRSSVQAGRPRVEHERSRVESERSRVESERPSVQSGRSTRFQSGWSNTGNSCGVSKPGSNWDKR